MLTPPFRAPRFFLSPAFPVAIIVVASAIGLSAHVIKSVDLGDRVTAFVSSPNPGSTDEPIRIAWAPTETGLKIACFYVANTSSPDPANPDWPRITSVGFELPGSPSGFALVAPLDGDWQLVEHLEKSLGSSGVVTLDFAIVARVNPTGRAPGSPSDLGGIPPGQARTDRTRFCVSGPFPDRLPDLRLTSTPGTEIPATIEALINGVVVGFHGVDGQHLGVDAGVWDAQPPNRRPVPMYQ
jgi:hypothetical protein